ncbi:hypothetical protein KX816_06895 [Sphingosinicellaceae bacterium]|nr:hypothetical protein KX816_06895 [Sphingosinicellaceae bacterium]
MKRRARGRKSLDSRGVAGNIAGGAQGDFRMATAAGAQRFDLGRVVARATGSIGRNIGLFAILAIGLEFVPALAVRALTPTPTTFTAGAIPGFGAGSLIGVFVGIAFFCLMIGTMIRAVVADQRGEKPELMPSLTQGARSALPMLVMFVLMYFAILIASVFFLVPGIILALMWAVAAPVMVEENAGIIGSLGRSRALTKGSRWVIFLTLLALLILYLLVLGGLIAIGGTYQTASGAGWFTGAAIATSQGFGGLAIAYMLANVVLSVVSTVLVAAIYVELRFVREGDRPESLAEVFA